ncbi:MAG: Holliday junction resolvase RuvX, partial [Akkermansia sp.]
MHPALGIDYGDARIGIAATDDMGILAYPVETVKNGAAPLDRIVALATQKAVKTLVLGIPVRMDGTEGTAAAKVRQFGDTLRALLPDIPMVYIDE